MKAEEYYLEKVKQFKDADDRIFDRPEVPENVETIHITAVCGKAMAPLAGLLEAQGYTITGSDKGCFPPMSDVLDKLGVTVKPYDEDNVKNADVVVIGNACVPSNPEAVYARENNVPQISISEALQQFVMKDRIRLVVAGTHGKTTTTGLLAHIFEVAEKDPGFSIGGTMQQKEETYALGTGEHFIIEGDEYNTSYFDKGPKFLAYKAHGGIITSMEYDHIDIYDDFKDYTKAFEFFVEALPEDGHIMIWGDDENVRQLKDKTKSNVHLFGFNEDNEYVVSNVRQGDGEQTFSLAQHGGELGDITTPMPGEYNILNIVGAVGLALNYGLEFDTVAKAVSTFKGMVKRQEVLFDNGVTVVDDYAHHPTSVEATLEGLKKHYPNRRTLVLFEPNSNTCRRKDFEERFADSLKSGDVVFVKQPDKRDSDSEDNFITTQNIVDQLQKEGVEAYNFNDNDEMVNKVMEHKEDNDVIIIMTNTSFDDVQGKILSALK